VQVLKAAREFDFHSAHFATHLAVNDRAPAAANALCRR
jgi:hypothetical protein